MAVQSLLHAFDRRSKDEHREVASEILRRKLQLDYPPLNDETLSRPADETFLELNVREDRLVEQVTR